MTYNVFSGTLSPTQSQSLPLIAHQALVCDCYVGVCVCVCLCVSEIASAADEFEKSLLTADADCSYDSVVEINLDTVSPFSLLISLILVLQLNSVSVMRLS